MSTTTTRISTTTTRAPTTTTRAPTTTTTTLPTDLSGLPTLLYGDSSTAAILATQHLLNSFGHELATDGYWGSQTADALGQLRAELGLAAGGLDEDLWLTLFSQREPADLGARISGVEEVPIPYQAVLIGTETAGLGVSDAAHYTLPFSTRPSRVSTWYQDEIGGSSLGAWNWCEEVTPLYGSEVLQLFWWQGTDRNLSVGISDMHGGRVDIVIAVENGVSVDGCAGTPTTTTRPRVTTTTRPRVTTTTQDVFCYAGMNLEDCETIVGLAMGDRLPTIDCSGSGRSVWWAANWWILWFQDGYPVISKDPNWCD